MTLIHDKRQRAEEAAAAVEAAQGVEAEAEQSAHSVCLEDFPQSRKLTCIECSHFIVCTAEAHKQQQKQQQPQKRGAGGGAAAAVEEKEL